MGGAPSSRNVTTSPRATSSRIASRETNATPSRSRTARLTASSESSTLVFWSGASGCSSSTRACGELLAGARLAYEQRVMRERRGRDRRPGRIDHPRRGDADHLVVEQVLALEAAGRGDRAGDAERDLAAPHPRVHPHAVVDEHPHVDPGWRSPKRLSAGATRYDAAVEAAIASVPRVPACCALSSSSIASSAASMRVACRWTISPSGVRRLPVVPRSTSR